MNGFWVIDTKATANRIRLFMKAKNITVKDIQKEMGFNNPQAVYRWLRGGVMTLDNLVALAQMFNCRLDDIVIIDKN